jgi:hypothetical protein
MSQMSFAFAHDLLITCFSKSNLSSVQSAEPVLHEGYSIDSTHTEPCKQAQFLGDGLSMSSLPQHFSTTKFGKGGFAVSFYVLLLLKRNYCGSRSANCRRVCKLLCKQSLLVMRRLTARHLCAFVCALSVIGGKP